MRALWTTFVPAILLAATFPGGAEPQAPADPFKISVNVDLVVLQASVHDRKGRLVTDLREQDFEVYEDGIRQPLRLFRHEDLPVTVGLAIDHSGSMRSKLPEVIAAARTFVRTSNPQDRLFVVNFNEKVTLGLPDTIAFTNRVEELERAITRMPATGMTALYDGLVAALGRLQGGSRDKSVLIAISDGGDNASAHTLAQTLRLAAQSSAPIYTIGIYEEGDPDRNPDVLRRLSAETGGEAYFPGELNDVVAICERIAREIRNQYTLGYLSANAEAHGGNHSIRVVAAGGANRQPAARARARYPARAGG